MSRQDRSTFLRQLPSLKPRTVIFWGENDPYFPVSQGKLAHSLISGSALHIFPGRRHAPQRESPYEFNHLISQFLSSLDDTRSTQGESEQVEIMQQVRVLHHGRARVSDARYVVEEPF